ncbi:MAG: beta-N-acetylhexosaminidase [Methylobacteriaceae bacterium]|nr:beta-N-acetylhexosaminidase [Methylobacteriaceae bacterium]MBV9703471.1 beta-N-acetylhexosaminidase [Methylobacteriaceae bacterium]
MTPRAFICGCTGTFLRSEERKFLAETQPWGLILFKRNIEAPDQVRGLVDAFRDIVGRADAPVLIDQEGGRVQRMGPPHWPLYPPAAVYDRLSGREDRQKQELAGLIARLIARDLKAVGIEIDCLPVLDVLAAGGHGAIGDRAYSGDPHKVAAFGRAAAEGLLAGGVLPVMKHAPGHGRARSDSHFELPRVDTDRAALESVDFHPFRSLRDLPIAMTGHVVFEAIDADSPATTSPKVIGGVIRGSIGFDGLLLTDDLSMQALSGPLGARARDALSAGVDIALHCNGNLVEAAEVAAVVPPLAGRARERAEAALARIGEAKPFDPVEARARLDDALADVGRAHQSAAGQRAAGA